MTTLTDGGKQPRSPEAQPRGLASLPGWSLAKRILRVVLALVLILLGLAALLTPLTPGSWLILVGLELLGLRVLLRKRVCAWADAQPGSRLRKAMCRVLGLEGFDVLRRKWRQRKTGKISDTKARDRESGAGQDGSCSASGFDGDDPCGRS
jgi:hypothetical protein